MNLVECHSDFVYAERPTTLIWQGERLEVESILAAWRIPEGRRFRVRTRNRLLFELTYREAEDEWQIQPITGG